ncbi:GNAT family N-acetyltransferase [Flocculibacter collagenilyticus]|uniref:GNAT family N-acetyltransferase n=1 Tax=Flocculibacter collagenilyticus TaxID=2744479 RepID=UPI0018F6B602|nr:GNAT family N-acetyltransferase [Flocculibacter collagenilyticus]
MEIKTISWEQAIPLRHRVLWPSKTPEFCYVEGDEEGLHFGAFIDEVLVCVASVYVHQNKARLRKFATDVRYQQQGIGSKMLNHIIQSLKASGLAYFWCDARETASGFYSRFGMHKSSERFYKSDVAYFKMELALQ